MKAARLWAIICVLIIPGLWGRVEGDEVRPLAFLHALQEQGYGDVAVDYLNLLRQRDEMPPELRETWDLEMSRSLRAAAQNAYNAQDAETLLRDAEIHLSKFIQENPHHAQADEAQMMWADFSLERALKSLRAAGKTAEKEQKAKLFKDARTALDQTRERLKEIGKKSQARLDALPPPPKRPVKREDREIIKQRQEIEAELMNVCLQQALIDYYLAQTYPDPLSLEHKKFLKTAADAFDAVFQANRLEMVGLLAHTWHGKTMEEMGNLQTALDIYDEVLANAPEPGQPQKDLELSALFTQVEHFRMKILAKRAPLQFIDEAGKWVQQYRKTKVAQTEGYQGIALDLAKAQLAAAESAAGSEKSRLVSSAISLLAEISQLSGPYQQEAILLRRQFLKSGVKGAEPGSFEEALALAEAAALGEQWNEAFDYYARALKLADKSSVDEAARQKARESWANVFYMQARAQLIAGKWEECIATAEKVVEVHKETPAAPMAASLAVSAALNTYLAAPAKQKATALDRLQKYAQQVVENWPDKPEADEARMMLAQASLAQGNIEEALAVFEKVDPRSDRYPNALSLAADTYWRRRQAEKAKPEESRDNAQMEADLQKALKNLEASLRLQRKASDLDKPLSRNLIETQLLLAEIKLEVGKTDEAINLLLPLIDAVKRAPPQEVDNTVARVFLCAVRAYLAENNLDKALEAGMLLAEGGPDIPAVNGALLELVKMLAKKLKQAEAEAAALSGTVNAVAAKAAQEKISEVSKILAKLLAKMKDRQQFSPLGTVFFADTCLAVDMDDAARELYLRVANQAEKNPAYAKTAGKALTWVQVRLVDLLIKNGDYEEAHKQAAQLAAANPRALEPLLQQGRILLAWAEKDPARYKDAVAHWTKLRGALLGMAKKPPEYYEATYNLASALYGQARATEDKQQILEKTKQAEQLLKATLILTPDLNGPEMVAQYNALLKKINALQSQTSSR